MFHWTLPESGCRRLLRGFSELVQGVQRWLDDRRGRRLARDEEGPHGRAMGPRSQPGGRLHSSVQSGSLG